MKNELVLRGVPESKIYLDYAGFRTFDSVVRCNKIFGQEKFTVISQKFHNQRAVFIARQKGLAAIGFNATDLSLEIGAKTRLREIFARVKVNLVLYFLNVIPKVLGDSIKIKESRTSASVED